MNIINHNSTDGLSRTERLIQSGALSAQARTMNAITDMLYPKAEVKAAGQSQWNADDVGALADLIKSMRADQKRLQAWAEGRLGHLMSDGAKEAFSDTAKMMNDIIAEAIKPAIYELDPQWMEDRV